MPTKTIAQLTPNPTPALTDLIEIDDGAGGSWKETAAQMLSLANPTTFNVAYTGTLPASFPVLSLRAAPGVAIVKVSGDTQILSLTGVATELSFSPTDPLALLTSLTLGNLAYVGGTFQPNTMASLTTLSLPALAYVGGSFGPGTMAALTSLSLPALAYVGSSFQPNTMASLTALSLPALAYVGSNFGPTAMASLTALSLPALAYVGSNFSPGTMASLTTIDTPALTFVGSNWAPTTMASLTSLTANNLVKIMGNVAPTTMASLTAISRPALTTIGGSTTISNMASLTTISKPAMISYAGVITMTTGLGNLTTVTLGTVGTLKSINGNVIISGQKLDQASVNGILALLVSLDGTNGTNLWGPGKTVNLSGGTSAAPSGQGIIDKATLIARTATVTTN